MEARIDTHPPIDSLKAFGLGLLDDASAHALFLHLEGCPPCRRRAEEASGDDFLARLQKARAANSTPAPAGQLHPLPGLARPADHGSTSPPDPARSLAPSLFGSSSPGEAPAGPAVPADLPPELAANQQYEVIRELGRGGMGVVYLARNKQMDRLEVLKVVNRALLKRPGTADRFLREIRSAAALEHKNVVRAYTYLKAGKLLALVMEYVEGEDLARLVDRRGPLSVSAACSSASQAARGLQEAHDKGMVHRDIKPQNLLLSRKLKEVMILDFGLAKVASEKGVEQGLTAEGKMLGTPGYVAPEQIRDAASADIRADIYSLGCTLYFLLTGRPPFDAPNLFALLHAHQFTDADPLDAVRPDVPPALAAVVARMMAKEPAKRYQKPADAAAALAPFLKGGKPAAPPPAVPKAEKPEPKTPSLPPPLPAHVQVELVPPPAVERAPFDLADLPAPAVSRKRKKNRGALAAVALALLVPLAVGIAMAVFRLETPNGTLIVEMNDDEVEARIKGGKLILTGPDGKVRYTLSAKERNKKLDAGPYTIRVDGADGLALDTPEFTMKKGGEVTVRVTLERKTGDREKIAGTKVYLSDLEAFDCVVNEQKLFKNNGDRGIAVNGEKFAKGLWMHPLVKNDAIAQYRLDGLSAFVFEAKVAIHDDARDGSASPLTFKVIGDGKVLWTSKPLQAPRQTEACSVNVDGIRVLELRVAHSGSYGNAHAVWLDPYVLCTRKLKQEPKASLDPDRKAAEYVLSIGGVVRVNGDERDLLSANPENDLFPWGGREPKIDRDIKVIAGLPREPFKLTWVELRGNNKVDDTGLAQFKGCQHVMYLGLPSTKITDTGLAYFKDCNDLRQVNLSYTAVSHLGLAPFKKFKKLAALGLEGVQVSDDTLAYFKDSKSLTGISLQNTKVTDAGLAHLEGCENLRSIDLNRTGVTDKGIAYLKNCKDLRMLAVVFTRVSQAGRDDMQKKFPKCRIIVN